MNIIGCIPSRYASTRLPGKPLCTIGNKPMVLHVLERAQQAKRLDKVIVLTDDERILNVVRQAGHTAIMTSPDCLNGTERIADYLKTSQEGDLFVNIQGDEVLLNATHVDELIAGFLDHEDAEMGTLAHWESDPDILRSPSTAKVVTDMEGNALYFSRNCIPITQQGALPDRALVQVGVYIYMRDTVMRLSRLQPSPLENIEKLEQLRALEHGVKISVTLVDHYQSLSVDTKEDLERAQALFSSS